MAFTSRLIAGQPGRGYHEEYQTNLIGEFLVTKSDAAAGLAEAPHRLRRRFYTHRYAPRWQGLRFGSALVAHAKALSVDQKTMISSKVCRRSNRIDGRHVGEGHDL